MKQFHQFDCAEHVRLTATDGYGHNAYHFEMKETTGPSSPSALMIALLESIANERILHFPVRIFYSVAVLSQGTTLCTPLSRFPWPLSSRPGSSSLAVSTSHRLRRCMAVRRKVSAMSPIRRPGNIFSRNCIRPVDLRGAAVHPVCESCAFSSVAA